MILKLSLSIFLIILSLIASYTMFEIFGKPERRKNMDMLKKIHRINGRLFFVLFLVGAVACIYMLSQTKAELTPRATLHAFSALAIFLLFSLKIAFIKYYRQFYYYAKLLGVIVVLLTFNLLAFSTGYSLVTGMDDKNPSKDISQSQIVAKSKEGNADRGKKLFAELCASCHYIDKKDFKRAAPGLKGILTEKNLPVSKKPANAENIISQLKKPYKYMPPFNDLTDEQLADLIAYMKTL